MSILILFDHANFGLWSLNLETYDIGWLMGNDSHLKKVYKHVIMCQCVQSSPGCDPKNESTQRPTEYFIVVSVQWHGWLDADM